MFFQHNQLRPSWKEVASVRLKMSIPHTNQITKHSHLLVSMLYFLLYELLVIWTWSHWLFDKGMDAHIWTCMERKNISSTGIAQEYVLQHTSQTMELVMKVARAYLTARSSSTKISVVEHTVHVRPHSRINSQYACPMQAILTMTCAHNSRC